jgi:3D (Asp-Asp-Asp) domain-containing protein
VLTTNIITAFVTAYVATGHVCANGHYPHAGYTIAAPRRFALGGDVFIGGHWYKIEDRTNKKYDGRFDIFVSTKQEALQWGKKQMKVRIVYEH